MARTDSGSSSGGGAVDSVVNNDGTLTISPTTGDVIVSLNLAHANTWTAIQTFDAAGIATTPTALIILTNSTAATALVPVQISADLEFKANMWQATGSGSPSAHTGSFRMYQIPSSGNLVNTHAGTLQFDSSKDGVYTLNIMSLGRTGNLTVAGTFVAANGITSTTGMITALASQVQAGTDLLTGTNGVYGGRIYMYGSVSGNLSFTVDSAATQVMFLTPVDMGAHKITSLLDPTNPQDAVTKAYADSLALGLSWKDAVMAVTTAPLPTYTYNNGASGVGATITKVGNGALPAIDGVTLVNGDRVLIKDEDVGAGNGPVNGIYDVTDVGSGGTPWILTRAVDNDTPASMGSATVSSAPFGVVNGASAFTQSTPAPITIGTSDIVWVNFLNTVYTAGTGLSLLSHVFSLDLTHANVWTGKQSFSSNLFALLGSGSGETILRPEAVASGTMTLPSGTDTLVTLALTQTLTNKRLTKRTGSVASAATPTINTDDVDMFLITALATNITSMTTNLSGTPTQGQTLWIAITGTAARTIGWGSGFEASTVALPLTTVSTDRLDIGFVWNVVTSKWRCVSVA